MQLHYLLVVVVSDSKVMSCGNIRYKLSAQLLVYMSSNQKITIIS